MSSEADLFVSGDDHPAEELNMHAMSNIGELPAGGR
jgi:hypothetical protein